MPIYQGQYAHVLSSPINSFHFIKSPHRLSFKLIVGYHVQHIRPLPLDKLGDDIFTGSGCYSYFSFISVFFSYTYPFFKYPTGSCFCFENRIGCIVFPFLFFSRYLPFTNNCIFNRLLFQYCLCILLPTPTERYSNTP